MKKVKLFNFRLPFALALSMACGVGFAFALAYFKTGYFYVITAVPFSAVIFIVFALKSRRAKTVVSCALVLTFFMFGAIYSAVNLSDYENSAPVGSEITRISGRVESYGKTQSGTVYFILSDLSVDGKPLKGRAVSYFSDGGGGYARAGYRINALCTVEKCDLFPYGKLYNGAIDGVRYKCIIYGTMQSSYGFSLFGSVNSAIGAVLEGNLSPETAAVARAMLTGDSSAMDGRTLSSFRYGGVAHIFAVSGLHIGIVFAVLSFILDKMRLNKYLAVAIKIAVTVFYAGVCGFTPSSVRATVMCAVFALSKLRHCKYDSLNALSVAVIILLAINPLNLFDVGFILSVSSILGIIFLAHNIRKVLGFLPVKARGGASVGIAAQAATLPGQMLAFGYVSGVGLVLNLAVLPLLSALYLLLFSVTLTSLIVPPAAAVMKFACLPLEAVINFFVSCGFENALIKGSGGWWAAVLPAVFLAALSDKFNLKLFVRVFVCAISALSFCLAAVFDGAVYGSGVRVTVGAYYGGAFTLIRTAQGDVLVVTQGAEAYKVNSFVNSYSADRVNDVIILGDDGAVGYYYQSGFGYKNIYLSSRLINVGADVNYVSSFSLYGADYEFVGSDALKVSVSGIDCAIFGGQQQTAVKADLIIALKVASGEEGVTVCYGSSGGDYNVYTQGYLQFSADNGKISVEGLLPLRREAGYWQ